MGRKKKEVAAIVSEAVNVKETQVQGDGVSVPVLSEAVVHPADAPETPVTASPPVEAPVPEITPESVAPSLPEPASEANRMMAALGDIDDPELGILAVPGPKPSSEPEPEPVTQALRRNGIPLSVMGSFEIWDFALMSDNSYKLFKTGSLAPSWEVRDGGNIYHPGSIVPVADDARLFATLKHLQ